MPLDTFLEIPDGERGWVWRYEIGRQFAGGGRLTFAFEKTHPETGTTYFLATFRDHDGNLGDRILRGVDAEPGALAGEIVRRWLDTSCEQPPAHVADEMLERITAWISDQRARSRKPNSIAGSECLLQKLEQQ